MCIRDRLMGLPLNRALWDEDGLMYDCLLYTSIRGVAKALYARMGDNVEIVGIANGYSGLINGDYREMNEDDFRGILTLGGTILGTKRTPFKLMRVVEDDNIDKVAAMKKTYKRCV